MSSCYRTKRRLNKVWYTMKKRIDVPWRHHSSSELLLPQTQMQKRKAATKLRLNKGKIGEAAVYRSCEQTFWGPQPTRTTWYSSKLCQELRTLSSRAALSYLLFCEALPAEDGMCTSSQSNQVCQICSALQPVEKRQIKLGEAIKSSNSHKLW